MSDSDSDYAVSVYDLEDNLNRPFQGLFRHIAGGAKHWGERAAKPWLPYILLMSER